MIKERCWFCQTNFFVKYFQHRIYIFVSPANLMSSTYTDKNNPFSRYTKMHSQLETFSQPCCASSNAPLRVQVRGRDCDTIASTRLFTSDFSCPGEMRRHLEDVGLLYLQWVHGWLDTCVRKLFTGSLLDPVSKFFPTANCRNCVSSTCCAIFGTLTIFSTCCFCASVVCSATRSACVPFGRSQPPLGCCVQLQRSALRFARNFGHGE